MTRNISADRKSPLRLAIIAWAKMIGIALLVLGFGSCCYMLDKFRWTL
jgi:hypothetical protein